MSATFAGTAGGATPPATVRVWDPFVRVFHWTIAALVVLALATGDEVERLHVAIGYAIAALVAVRVVWGFAGPKRARFSDFVKPPSEVLRFVGQSLRLKAARHLGHNPAGGAMIIAMFVLIAFISATGFMLTTVVEPAMSTNRRPVPAKPPRDALWIAEMRSRPPAKADSRK
jgi:cytochrome b